jgi:Domain of unknown function (DUF4386)
VSSVQRYARAAGIMFLISFVAGSFGEFYVPSKLIVAGNAAATVSNIVEHEMLFRLGFAGYLLEALCDVGLALVLCVLLRPVHRNLALLSAFFGLVSTALFAVCEMLFFCAPLLVKNPVFAQSFTREQLDALVYFFVRVYALGAGLFMVFYGSASLIRSYLIYRSGYIPRFIGVLFGLVGVAFIVKNFTLVVAPAYSWDLLLAPAPIMVLVVTVWFLAKGVDVDKWNERVSGMRPVMN